MTMSKVNKKQLKITKLFRKGNKRPRILKESNENSELQQEVEELEQKLKEKQDYLFQIQREICRHQVVAPQTTQDNDTAFTKSIMLQNRIGGLQKTLDMAAMLTGLEVESCTDNSCTVIFHMQLDRDLEVKHGVTISEVDGVQRITARSLPLGFNFKSVLEGCNNEVSLNTFDVIRKALTAYYARLEQYEDLKDFLNLDASLFKLMDGTQIEITFLVKDELDENADTTESITFILFYTMNDIRPRDFACKQGLADKSKEVFREQFLLFKKRPLKNAFKMAFIDGEGPYKLARHLPPHPSNEIARRKPHRSLNRNNANDDTFRVEQWSESSEDEAEDY